MEKILLLSAFIVIICIMSTRFSNKFNIPSLLFFVVLGMLLGNDGIFKFHFDNFILSQQISIFCLIFIMFYGGFGINWNKAKCIAPQAAILSTLGVVLTCVFVGLFSHYILKLGLLEGMLIGAVLSSTDAASVFNILKMRKLNLKHGIGPLIEMESGSNDPFAYMITIIILGLLSNQSVGIFHIVTTQLLFGLGFGILFGFGSVVLLNYMKFMEEGLQAVFVAMIALLAYSLPAILQGNGFLSVYICGIILGNSRLRNKVETVVFFDSITQMMQIVLFFFMGFLSFPSHIPSILIPAISILIFLTLVARPLTVFLCLHPFKLPFNQKLFISWSGLRGVASIVFAIMTVVSPIAIKNDIFHIVFFIALVSITIQGGLLPFMARRFDVLDDSNDIMKTFNDYIDTRLRLISIPVSSKNSWVNKYLQEIEFPTQMLVVSILREGKNILPKGNIQVKEGDTLVCCSHGYEGNKLTLEEIEIHPGHKWINKKFKDLDSSNSFLAVMIKRKDEVLIPKGDSFIKEGDIIVICEDENAPMKMWN